VGAEEGWVVCSSSDSRVRILLLGRARAAQSAETGAVLGTGLGWLCLVKECLARRGRAEESRG
jgi:hypothetical protein